MHNSEIAEEFYRLAELLEIEGANSFRVRAYRNAARTIENLGEDVARMLARGADLTDLPGIGKDLAGKISKIVNTGHFELLEEVEHRLPASLVELSTIPGLGPKRIKCLHEELGINSPAQLAEAIAAGKLEELPGFGGRLIAKITQTLDRHKKDQRRVRLAAAESLGEDLLAFLKHAGAVRQAEIAGSYRRRRDTVGDLDIVVASDWPAEAMARFIAYPKVAEVVAEGPTRATVLLRSGLQADLRVVEPASYGAALLYFTGSKAHNIALRGMAAKRGLKLNEYGVFRKRRPLPGAATEAEIYSLFDLPYIEPELREDRGEIEAARARRLPKLVTLDDIRGDLHVHTEASDGRDTIAEIAAAAKARGYAYVAITDHTHHLTVANGLDPARLKRQLGEIDRLRESVHGIHILKSAEIDILDDGRLDLPDDVLKELDFAVCAIHSQFDLPRDKQTARILRAMENPYFTILAHPTGRLINARDAYDVDIEQILRAAKARGCYLEINAQPERLDLTDIHARLAKEMGVKVAISTDAHSTAGLDYMRYGVGQARRGWIEAKDVLNCRPWTDLKRLLARS